MGNKTWHLSVSLIRASMYGREARSSILGSLEGPITRSNSARANACLSGNKVIASINVFMAAYVCVKYQKVKI